MSCSNFAAPRLLRRWRRPWTRPSSSSCRALRSRPRRASCLVRSSPSFLFSFCCFPPLTGTLSILLARAAELIQLTSKPAAENASFTHSDLLARLKQAAAICSTPASKAEFLGYALVQQIFRCLETHQQQVEQYQEMLLGAFNGNRDVLPGVFAAVESKTSPLFASSSAMAQLALAVISPLCVRILIGAKGTQFV